MSSPKDERTMFSGSRLIRIMGSCFLAGPSVRPLQRVWSSERPRGILMAEKDMLSELAFLHFDYCFLRKLEISSCKGIRSRALFLFHRHNPECIDRVCPDKSVLDMRSDSDRSCREGILPDEWSYIVTGTTTQLHLLNP
jgi:hypothetical protein